ncbi:hypothetical protein PNOK_0335400 [Pyrrhoderma noxium]|uniref:DUF4187 domain-containing protein n=1 Tax=Pyrrhoderma noxium TaxID=2282107 RepID=A0A286UM93_9AGAM|nr:hypothetical protein PNOK_0335400 [Pyrrhoderma noxium]
MASNDDEDDYLSDKFLFASEAAASSSKAQTYSERRKQAQKQSDLKNKQNRTKSRRERELEAREEGLKRSLFERAKEEEEQHGKQNKAMNMMLRMGFKPGHSLGSNDSGSHGTGDSDRNTEVQTEVNSPVTVTATTSELHTTSSLLPKASPEYASQASNEEAPDSKHRSIPLPVETWIGKKGVGLGKRASSPDALERAAKAARIEEQSTHDTFRSRTREAFEERRALGRLSAARRTLLSLDEKAGIQFNFLSLDPTDLTDLPPELLEVLSDSLNQVAGIISLDQVNAQPNNPVDKLKMEQAESERLRKQMQADALQPVPDLEPDEDEGAMVTHGSGNGVINNVKAGERPKQGTELPLSLSDEDIDEARAFLMLNARDRLGCVLSYLRHKYHYCFWCGTRYSDKIDLDSNCPGEDEEAHD